MLKGPESALDVILVVEDEEAVLRTIQEWLSQGNLGVEILTARDAETALRIASSTSFDLAVLDWNLGSGINGLDLLEDLVLFHPHLIAILVTGYANQATPLHAMRIGVRDYLDKNQELTREKFLAAVKKQLDWIRPAKRQRQFLKQLQDFRECVGKAVAWVDSSSRLLEENHSQQMISLWLGALTTLSRGKKAFLQVNAQEEGDELLCIGQHGTPWNGRLVPLSSSFAGQALSQGKPLYAVQLNACANNPLFSLQEFEKGHATALLLPFNSSHVWGVIEVLDADDLNLSEKEILERTVQLGAYAFDLTRRLDKSEAVIVNALKQASRMAQEASLDNTTELKVIENSLAGTGVSSEELRFLEMVRELSRDHGPVALAACGDMVLAIRKLMSAQTEVPGE